MAERQFVFNTNVSITENFATNFFDVSEIQILAKSSLSITSTEKCAEVLKEMADAYNEIDDYCNNNINEQNIYTFVSKMQEAMINLKLKNLQEMSFAVRDVTCLNTVFLNVGFIIG